MPRSSEPKPISEYTHKDWRNLTRYLAFLGVFMALIGVYQRNWDLSWLGIIFVLIAIIAGFVLQFFFGIKIIDLRRDFKNKKY